MRAPVTFKLVVAPLCIHVAVFLCPLFEEPCQSLRMIIMSQDPLEIGVRSCDPFHKKELWSLYTFTRHHVSPRSFIGRRIMEHGPKITPVQL